VLERLRSSVEFSECVWDDVVIPVTISLGAAATEHLGFDLDYLYAAADASLYRAKNEGRNCIRWATARKSDPERESWTSRLIIQA
jgi:GGDEF domain-containing protein